MSGLAAAFSKLSGQLASVAPSKASQMRSLLNKGLSKSSIRGHFATQRIAGGLGAAEGAFGAVGNTISQRSPFAAAGGALSGAGDKLMMTGNPYAVAAGAVLKFTGELVGSVDKLHKWGAELEAGNFQFAEFSASMAQVQANRQIQQYGLAMEHGEARADSAGKLSDAMTKLEQNTAPLEDLWANFQNGFGAEIIDKVADAVAGINQIVEYFWGPLGKKAGDEEAITMNDLLLQIERDEKEAQNGRPKRLGGAK